MSYLTPWIHTSLAQTLGWSLVHFVWEGAVLAAVLMAMLQVFRAEPAQRRYTLACLILAAMPVAFAVTLAAIWIRRPVAVAAPIHWVAVTASAGSIDVPSPRFSWRGGLDRLTWLVPVWFAGVAFFYARGLAGWTAVRRLRSRGVCVHVLTSQLQQQLAELISAEGAIKQQAGDLPAHSRELEHQLEELDAMIALEKLGKMKAEENPAEVAALSASDESSRTSSPAALSKKQPVTELNRRIAEQIRKEALLRLQLYEVRFAQSRGQAGLNPATFQVETRAVVNESGHISIQGRGYIAATGLTPAQVAADLGENARVRIVQTASQTVTVLVPIPNTRDRFHVFIEVKTNLGKIVQSFQVDSTSEALARALPLHAGSYHLIVVMKNLASGETNRSELDFTVD